MFPLRWYWIKVILDTLRYLKLCSVGSMRYFKIRIPDKSSTNANVVNLILYKIYSTHFLNRVRNFNNRFRKPTLWFHIDLFCFVQKFQSLNFDLIVRILLIRLQIYLEHYLNRFLPNGSSNPFHYLIFENPYLYILEHRIAIVVQSKCILVYP